MTIERIVELEQFIEREMKGNEALTNDAGCVARAKIDRDILACLKELQTYRNNLTNQSLSDVLVHSENENERLHDRVNELSKELKAHREAWVKVITEIKEYQKDAFYYDDVTITRKQILEVINKYKPKEGEVE